MFERFTDAARLAVVKAQEEARLLHHDAVGPEHLLLGLLQDEQASSSLFATFVSAPAVREHVEATLGRGAGSPPDTLPFAPQAKAILEGATAASRRLGHQHTDSAHLVIALLREEGNRASEALVALGVDLTALQEAAMAAVGVAATVPGYRTWVGGDPLHERVVRARARAQAERDPVHEGGPGGWEVLLRSTGATLRALAAARRHAADALRGELATIDLVVGVLAVDDPAVRDALAAAGASDPRPHDLVPGYRETTTLDESVVGVSGAAKRTCRMAARLAANAETCISPAHLLLAALESLGPVRAAVAAERLGADEAALRQALLRLTVTAPTDPAIPGSAS
ncbi:MAG TPA: Clp protease N-terminal domain-containing protein [Egibacteraceae bacterium]|jgi:hypothetical protein|nr:Clp protease N-terminal domain-containing protein [Egibacteraceae bacterium]